MKRYDDSELLILLRDIESDRIERKRNFSDPERVRQAVCAFANDLPNHNQAGVIFIGAEDDGLPSAIHISDELLRKLSDMKTDGNILPLPALTVEKRTLDGAEIAIVTVMPSDMPPVKYNGRIWVRTGPRRSIANEQEERILIERRRYKFLPFDLSPVVTATVADLSKVVFEEEYLPAAFAADILAQNHRSYEERLASCRMIVSPDEPTPTVLGLLILGKRPQDFIYGAYIQFLRVAGMELGEPVIDELRAEGNLGEMLRRVEEKLLAHNRRAYDISNGPHVITDDYPLSAVKQILYNAMLHRTYEGTNAPVHVYWYNDRIEIRSPGGPYGNVTNENFGVLGMVDYRNPNIAAAMKNLNFIQQFGQGINTARLAMRKNGNPPPEFIINQSAVLCILRGKEK